MEKKEEEIFEQLQLFRALMDNIPDPVYYKDTKGLYLGYNKAFQDYFGLDYDSYVGRTVFDLPISRKEAMLHHKADVELIQLSGTKTYEAPVTSSDNSVRYMISKKAAFKKADGTIGGIVGIITDITRLKRAEEALEESKAIFIDLSGASFETILFIENGLIIDVNKRFYEMFGYNDNEGIGKKVIDLVAPEARTLSSGIVDSQNGETHKTIGLKKDGIMFPIEVRQRKLQLGKRDVEMLIVRELTEQKNREEESLKSKNMQSVGTLAAGIAHDFNNLLMAIVGNISLAKMSMSKDEKITEFLNEAERIVFMGKNLTQQLLTFSHSGELVRKIVFMGRMIRDVTDKILKGSSVRPRYIIPMDLLPVEVDEDQMRQVIKNMVMNAKEAMPSGGTIVISCENVSITPQDKLPLIKEDHIKISIHDEGIGIPEENISKIFDPYFTTKGMGSQKGVGLGLAICYSIVRKHNGYILIDSVPDKGSTFQIFLPATKKDIIDVCIEEEGIRHRKGRVLVMDDEEMILKIAKELLQLMDYEVTIAQNGEETIGFYRQAMELRKPFDAVILDLAIPDGMGGKEVMQELIAIDPQVKAIISSGYVNDPVMKNFKEYGFLDMLTKPYETNELDAKLRTIIKTDNRQ
ncbi:MAG: sensor hybrid histidine kinase [Deltaproteobacteria bacterium]|nr:sensor hybrid histidine kinase [Deltaproteobacteria bacterium]